MIAEVVSYKKKFLVVLLLLFSIGINQYYGSRGVFPIDSFFHFDNGYRLLNGDSPFSNFWTVSGPAVDYIQAAFFFIFGVNWHSYVLHGSLLNALVTIYTFFVLKEFKLKTNFCFLYSLLFCILAYPSSGTPFVDHHSALFSLLAVYSFLLAINNKKKKHWVLIPIFSGLAFFSKQVPAAYIILTISFLLIFYSYKKKTFLYIKYCLLSSIIFIFLIFIFGKTQGIELSSFLNQYIFYPQTIGLGRLEKFHFTFQGVVAHFKFIYFAILPLLYVNYKKFYNIKNYYKRDEIYILLILLSLTFFYILHQLLTKNQTFIFFLIPLLTAFSHIALNNFYFKLRKLVYIIMIFLCIFSVAKYHLRFNEDRKFHELSDVNLNLSVEAENIDKKFAGLNWISPEFSKTPKEEIDKIKEIKNYLKNDPRKKMLITNYIFFSAILDEKLFSPSRAFTSDGTTHPLPGNKYFKNYRQLMTETIKKNQIEVIYIAGTLEDKHIYNYINRNCFKEKLISNMLRSYEVINCEDIKR